MLLSCRRSTVTSAPRSTPVFWSGEFLSSLDVTRKVWMFLAKSTSAQAPATLVSLPSARYTRAPAASAVLDASSLITPPTARTAPKFSMRRPCTSITPRNSVGLVALGA